MRPANRASAVRLAHNAKRFRVDNPNAGEIQIAPSGLASISIRLPLMLRRTVDLDYGRVGRGCSSVVERQLPKLNVVGSIPITRSST